ncbi:Transcriptional activator HlyU [Thalassocella blandensis]|nr:Transcriptional activator HlyU [Thalassocella blandensis]
MTAQHQHPLQAMAEHATEAAKLLKLLANENRLMICCALGEQELNVGEINDRVPLSQSALSQHLAKLREADIVRTRKEGLIVYYRLNGSNAMQIIHTLKSIYCPEM